MITKKVLNTLEYFKVLEYIAKYSYTEIGKELILTSLPFNNSDLATKCGLKVSEAKRILIENDIPPLEFIPNIHTQLSQSKIEGSILTIKNIRDVQNLLAVSRKLKSFLISKCESTSLNSEFNYKLFSDKSLENEIDLIFTSSGEIKDSASNELKKIRSNINEKSDELRKTVNKILKQLSKSLLVQEEYITMRDGRVVLPIKAEHKRQVKGFIHSESGTGQTIYIEPEESLELNNDLLSLRFAESREIEKILKQITKRIGEASIALKLSLNTIAELDSYFAKAQYSLEIIGDFPTIDNSKPFKIIDGFHPILLKKLSRKNTVPLNLEIKDAKIIVITGPNAGGKTLVLKSTGLLTLLVMTGLHVPISPDSNFHFFSNLLVDIGDQQSIEDDLSTFSSHLANIRDILEVIDKDTLIILDELGTGTDPTEGASLASAILLEMRDKGSTVLATTHHGDLKILANSEVGLENASMEYNIEELKPTYKFKQGLPGSSYAFEVASRIGISENIIVNAKSRIKNDSNKIEEFLIDLENKTRKIQVQLNKYEIENTRLKGLANLYQAKLNKLETDKKGIISDAKLEASEILNKVNREVELTIKSIREGKADKTVIKKAKENINSLKEASKIVQPKNENIKVEIPKVGDFVRIIDTTTTGEIISVSGNVASIVSGNIKVKAKVNRLEYAKRLKTKVDESYKYYNVEIASSRLDIRGNKPEEIEFEVVKFLDNAYSNNLASIEIVHGKGNGVLKQMVHELLNQHAGVKDYAFAKIEFGGEGVTIINLK
ncbi:MAG: endonuclease MutS2 [Bacteroidetes bacterium]|nr:endonuclease MutS2 [Bacteroidota bacterium]MBU1115085.1 endonuclease MutS2 [Bacteroidota bacterium]MBU1799005.1 endonuclease MutS2 [Bacteroidota bacterium]